MRTERAPTTALSGKNKSEDALAISTAILAAAYAVLQRDSLDDPPSLGVVSPRSQEGEAIDKEVAPEDASGALRSLAGVADPCPVGSVIGGVGVRGVLFIGFAEDEDFLRRRRMVDARTKMSRPLLGWLGGLAQPHASTRGRHELIIGGHSIDPKWPTERNRPWRTL